MRLSRVKVVAVAAAEAAPAAAVHTVAAEHGRTAAVEDNLAGTAVDHIDLQD